MNEFLSFYHSFFFFFFLAETVFFSASISICTYWYLFQINFIITFIDIVHDVLVSGRGGGGGMDR